MDIAEKGGRGAEGAGVLDVDAAERIGMRDGRGERHGLRQGGVVGLILVVEDAGGQCAFRGGEREFAAATEEVAGLRFGDGSYLSASVFDEPHFDGIVVVGRADKAQTVASERAGIEFDTDVEVLARGAAEALSHLLAGVEAEAEALALVLLALAACVHHAGTTHHRHEAETAVGTIFSFTESPDGDVATHGPVVLADVVGLVGIEGPCTWDDLGLVGDRKVDGSHRHGNVGRRGHIVGAAVERAARHHADVLRIGLGRPG